MANNPNPEFIQEIMENDFGTRVLITDPKADVYLEQARKLKMKQIKEKFPQWVDESQESE